jgi:F-type H+-transporting ATPase subunit gamma
MPSLIDIRRRIRTVKNTQQITKAMKMVASAKLRRAQDRVVAARPYAAMLGRVLVDVSAAAAQTDAAAENPLLAVREENRVLLILVTSDRGLAGAFNSNLNKAGQQFLARFAGKSVEMETLGRKGRDFFRRRANVTGELVGVSDKPTYANAQAIAKKAMDRYAAGEIDAVYIIYNEFKSVLSQKLTEKRVLPAALDGPREGVSAEFIYEQPPEQLLGSLLPRYVELAIYHAMIESAAAEFAARMTAMESATRNASEVIDKLTLNLNRVRQASITREIIEVVSGASALD